MFIRHEIVPSHWCHRSCAIASANSCTYECCSIFFSNKLTCITSLLNKLAGIVSIIVWLSGRRDWPNRKLLHLFKRRSDTKLTQRTSAHAPETAIRLDFWPECKKSVLKLFFCFRPVYRVVSGINSTVNICKKIGKHFSKKQNGLPWWIFVAHAHEKH